MPKIVVVTPTIRPESMVSFREAWAAIFAKHAVTLITVWDGEVPRIEYSDSTCRGPAITTGFDLGLNLDHADLFCRHTDACRNLGFVAAAHMAPDFILTLDDDCHPPRPDGWNGIPECYDPIQAHLDILAKRVPISWMNTAMGDLYLRGVPYGVRDEAPVMLSHGVWVGTPDFDGETQLRLEAEGRLPHSLHYHQGPVPKGVPFPLCGMNVMVRREALPYFYFAPMGPDTGITTVELVNNTGRLIEEGELVTDDMVVEKKVPALHRFGDIWMGVHLKRQFDELGWACYTGGSTVLHMRASDARKNAEQEKLGRGWNERIAETFDGLRFLSPDDPFYKYFSSYADKRRRYAALIRSIFGEKS